MPTLYQRILGERFAELHPILQSFHSQGCATFADCSLEVIHPPGTIKTWLRTLSGVPSAGKHETTLLEVIPFSQGETWRRTMGRRQLVTRQWAAQNLLMEGVGPAVFGIEVIPWRGGMRFETRRFWLLGVPILKWFSPRVSAVVEPREKGWQVEVQLAVPFLGTLLIYRGEVKPR